MPLPSPDIVSRSRIRQYSLSVHGPSFRLRPDFQLWEFASRDGADEVILSDKVLDVLQDLRTHLGRSVTILSGYRTVSHNTAEGGSDNSRHTTGEASDVHVKGAKPAAIAAYLKSHRYVETVGVYDWGCHFSVRRERSALFDRTSDGLTALDRAGINLLASLNYLRFNGLPPAVLVGVLLAVAAYKTRIPT